MKDYTLENIYGILLSVQMLASDIEQCARENPESITLLSGITESALEQAKTAAYIMREYYDDEKSATYTESVTSRLETIINEYKEDETK